MTIDKDFSSAYDRSADLARVTAERDALAVSLAKLREAARRFYAGMMPVSFEAGIYAERGSGPESSAVVAEAYSAADHCDTIITVTSSPAEHGARVIAEAEKRGAETEAERWRRLSFPSAAGLAVVERAEERGARWYAAEMQRQMHGASVRLQDGRVGDADTLHWDDPAEVCRAARERKETRWLKSRGRNAMSIEELRARLVEHLAIRAYRTEDGDPSLKALVEYERAVRAEALEEAAEERQAIAGIRLARDTEIGVGTNEHRLLTARYEAVLADAVWLRDRAARERKETR